MFSWEEVIGIILLIVIIYMVFERNMLKNKLSALKETQNQIIIDKMVELKVVSHNINTPLNTIIMVLDCFKMRLYGDIPQKYNDLLGQSYQALDELKLNLQDLTQYCSETHQAYHDLTQMDLKQNNALRTPYVLTKKEEIKSEKI